MKSVPWVLILQVVLIVAWYAVPSMAALPAWVVFLPLIAAGTIWGVVLLVFGVIFVIAALAATSK